MGLPTLPNVSPLPVLLVTSLLVLCLALAAPAGWLIVIVVPRPTAKGRLNLFSD